MTFTKYQCWQTERVGQVIAKAALDVDRATFLATHMPMREIVYEKSPLAIDNTSEQNLLGELDRMALEDQHVFAVVKGIPGTGKSHLIRWLFERYRQNHLEDRVLLIERANASLKKTIQQIIDSGVFQSSKLNEQLNQLRNATTILSSQGLADTLLNNLQVATSETTWHEKLHHRISAEKISSFLLDQTVREHLKRPGGPIERVVKYLQEGRGIRSDELPGFKPEELVFDPRQKGKIRSEGYRDVQEVADDISRDNSKQREQLTRYLNFLLTNYAISRTTNLSASDLREMFNELRRHLRQQGQNLALFIEDITAFTGIDAGLIDVLITQHTGGDNRAFCRLTSVIGITDAYFADNLPDNVRERITHQLTLNARTGAGESDMLRDESTLVEFVAHYLNAVRLGGDALEDWERSGAVERNLPNACMACQFRQKCHAAFGYANISTEDTDATRVGLYPFNATALVRMYRNLDNKYARTPRSLLDNILSYVLQSHGEQIVSGRFPPVPNRLAPAVGMQEFEPTAHARIVDQQGGADAERLKTLLLYWGERHAFKRGELVGDLPIQVFEAFGLPVIEGRSDSAPINVAPATIGETRPANVVPNIVPVIYDVAPPAGSQAVANTQPPAPAIKSQSDHIEDISRWASGGYLPSQVSNVLLQRLAELFETGIEWDAYGLSLNNVPLPSQASRFFAIEGQSAAVSRQLVFARSDSLRYALEALANLNDNTVQLTPAQYGEHLVALEAWLRQEEASIIEYVRLRAPIHAPEGLLMRLLVQNTVMLAFLARSLNQYASVKELFHQIVTFSAGSEASHKAKWTALTSDNSFPDKWAQLIKDVLRNQEAALLLQHMLGNLNVVQGDSRDIRFLNAAPALQILSEFEDQDWMLEPLSKELERQHGHQEWDVAISIHRKLHGGLQKVVDDAYSELQQYVEELDKLFGDHDLKSTFDQIQNLLQRIQSLYNIDSDLMQQFNRHDADRLNANRLTSLLAKARPAIGYGTLSDRATFISKGYTQVVIPLREYVYQFRKFVDVMNQAQLHLRNNQASRAETEQVSDLIKSTRELYEKTIHELSGYVKGDETDAT